MRNFFNDRVVEVSSVVSAFLNGECEIIAGGGFDILPSTLENQGYSGP